MLQQPVPKVKPREFLYHIHYLRGLAIILIVAYHCHSSLPWSGKIEIAQRTWLSFIAHGTVVFVFISGYLFEHVFVTNFSYKPYLLKKLKYIILPYLIFSVPTIIDELFFAEYALWKTEFYLELPNFAKVFYLILTGKHFGPYWFIPMIAMIFLISPLLVYLDQKKYFYQIIFPVLFGTTLFLFQYGHETNLFVSFVYFLPVYIFGMFVRKYNQDFTRYKRPVFIISVLLFTVITLLEIIGILQIGKKAGYFQPLFDPEQIINFTKLKFSLLSIILFYILLEFKDKKIKFLELLAVYSFGIYFLHLYVIRIIEAGLGYIGFSFQFNYITFPLYVAFILVLNVFILNLLKRIFKRNSRYIIGS